MGKSKELATLTDAGGDFGGNLNVSGIVKSINGTQQSAIYNYQNAMTIQAADNGNAMPINFYNGGTNTVAIDASGRVTMPYQPHIFGTPGVGSSNTGGTASIFTTKSSYGLSFSNSRITVPVTGVYMITFTTITYAGSGRIDTKIVINNSYRISGLNNQSDNGGSSDYRHRSMSATVKLAANDYIQFESGLWYANGTAYDEWQTASVTLLG